VQGFFLFFFVNAGNRSIFSELSAEEQMREENQSERKNIGVGKMQTPFLPLNSPTSEHISGFARM